MTRWWLSFADESKPVGSQLLGGCIVQAVDFASAIQVAWQLGINPGGQVQGHDIDEEKAALLSFPLPEEKLLSPDEMRALADRCSAEAAS